MLGTFSWLRQVLDLDEIAASHGLHLYDTQTTLILARPRLSGLHDKLATQALTYFNLVYNYLYETPLYRDAQMVTNPVSGLLHFFNSDDQIFTSINGFRLILPHSTITGALILLYTLTAAAILLFLISTALIARRLSRCSFQTIIMITLSVASPIVLLDSCNVWHIIYRRLTSQRFLWEMYMRHLNDIYRASEQTYQVYEFLASPGFQRWTVQSIANIASFYSLLAARPILRGYSASRRQWLSLFLSLVVSATSHSLLICPDEVTEVSVRLIAHGISTGKEVWNSEAMLYSLQLLRKFTSLVCFCISPDGDRLELFGLLLSFLAHSSAPIRLYSGAKILSIYVANILPNTNVNATHTQKDEPALIQEPVRRLVEAYDDSEISMADISGITVSTITPQNYGRRLAGNEISSSSEHMQTLLPNFARTNQLVTGAESPWSDREGYLGIREPGNNQEDIPPNYWPVTYEDICKGRIYHASDKGKARSLSQADEASDGESSEFEKGSADDELGSSSSSEVAANLDFGNEPNSHIPTLQDKMFYLSGNYKPKKKKKLNWADEMDEQEEEGNFWSRDVWKELRAYEAASGSRSGTENGSPVKAQNGRSDNEKQSHTHTSKLGESSKPVEGPLKPTWRSSRPAWKSSKPAKEITGERKLIALLAVPTIRYRPPVFYPAPDSPGSLRNDSPRYKREQVNGLRGTIENPSSSSSENSRPSTPSPLHPRTKSLKQSSRNGSIGSMRSNPSSPSRGHRSDSSSTSSVFVRRHGGAACTRCLLRGQCEPRTCERETLPNGEPVRCTQSQLPGRAGLVNPSWDFVCIGFNTRSGCKLDHTHPRHECSGCGSNEHGAQNCPLGFMKPSTESR